MKKNPKIISEKKFETEGIPKTKILKLCLLESPGKFPDELLRSLWEILVNLPGGISEINPRGFLSLPSFLCDLFLSNLEENRGDWGDISGVNNAMDLRLVTFLATSICLCFPT